MPRKPLTPEEYGAVYDPDYSDDEADYDDEVLPRSDNERSGKRIRESDMGIIGGEEPTTTLETDNDFQSEIDQELAEQQRIYQEELEKYEKKKEIKETKGKIKETKRQIKRLKYAPVYDAGETLKDAGEKIIGKIKESRGTPEERKAKRQAMQKKMKRFKEGTQKMMTALGGVGSNANNSPIQGNNAFFGVPGMETNMFAREVGGSGAQFDLITGGKPDNKANNLIGNQQMGAFNINLLGGGGDAKHKDIGSFGSNIFGSGESNMFKESLFFSNPNKNTKNKKSNNKKPVRLI